ncbi:hypothetical protein [Dyella sp.]|uniref:hypothetical protein n=1 Tax=Dyella sp. TaxID=1869338 RepID=UPI002ED1C28B
MSLNKALTEAQSSIPECVASGYVDMSTGLLLGVKTVDNHPSQVLELVAAATGDLFQGRTVMEVERLFDQSRGISERSGHYFKEIIVTSTNLIHVFMRCERNRDHVAVFVCRISANIGMVLAKARLAKPLIEASV